MDLPRSGAPDGRRNFLRRTHEEFLTNVEDACAVCSQFLIASGFRQVYLGSGILFRHGVRPDMNVVGERRLAIRPRHADSRSLEDVLPFAAQAFGRINEATGRNLN